MQVQITDTLNARSYALFFSIATTSLNQIRDLQPPYSENHSKQQFSVGELKMICFDYLFSTYENFLEHLGYLLFEDWDSAKEQSHYANKLKRLKDLMDAIHFMMIPSDFDALCDSWIRLLDLFDVKKYKDTRNSIKHTHSGKHDTKTIEKKAKGLNLPSTVDVASLIVEMPLGITTDDCENFRKDLKAWISNIHQFIKENKMMFWVANGDSRTLPIDESKQAKVNQRQVLFDMFCEGLWTPPAYMQIVDS